MSIKSLAALALATGFAAAKPIHSRRSALTPRQGFGNNGGFNFIDGFNGLNNQQQIINIQEQNLQIVDNGFQQQIVQQASEVLIVQEQNNGFNNQLNNLFRKSNFQNQFPDQSTVLMVVQEIQVSVDDGFGNAIEQQLFAQSVVVANRGLAATQTVMIQSSETIIAQDFLGQAFNQGFDGNFDQFAKLDGAFPTANADVQLFGQKPVWDNIAEDPAANLGGVWQKELEDLNNVDNKNLDNQKNNELAAEEKRLLDEQNAAEEQQGEENQDEQNQEEEQQNQEEQQAAEEQAAAEEQMAAEEQAAAEEEQAAAEEEQAAAEEEQAPAEEEQVNTEVQA